MSRRVALNGDSSTTAALELRDSDQPNVVLRLSRRDALTLVDAARRGEVYPFGTAAVD